MTDLYETIRSYLADATVGYRLVEHEPVQTSEEARNVLGHAPEEGTKSLALDADGTIVVATVPEPRTVPISSVAGTVGADTAQLCDPSVVESCLGTELGGVSPFGYGSDVRTLVDPALFEVPELYFNPGRNDVTAVVSGDGFRSIAADWSIGRIDSE
jgi:prolyl-tRNA editing enzyme YbaK/EbsC (Cys-tRNA(Pro) deacylase)